MKVREVRVALGWRISELAKLSGVSDETIRRIERGDSVLETTLSRVVVAFNESGRLRSAIGRERVSLSDFDEAKRMKQRS
jgi:transcriptional regulator with XRE-family HTH domain